MMKFDIKNRFTGAINFTAEIDCDEDTSISIKLGLAVIWGIKNNANLSYANLSSANLSSADLRHANLSYADLRHASLRYADLRHASLSSADLRHASLSYADLRHASLRYANLSSANLSSADLRHANLIVIYGLGYDVIINNDEIRIGCELHKTTEWDKFTEDEIKIMDGDRAAEFWAKNKTAIIAIAKTVGGK